MLAAFCLPTPAEKDGLACYELREVPIPTLDGLPSGSVLIKAVASSICGSDLLGKGGCARCPEWRRPIDHLQTFLSSCGGSGHEVIGEVHDAIPPCSLTIGQRVLAMTTGYIHKVSSVRKVFEDETQTKASALPRQGSFAEYFVSHSCACIPIPSDPPYGGFDPLWFVAAQPLGTILHACKKLGSVVGSNVAVVGQGQNGLMMTQMLANMGARRIIALDLLEDRLERSRKMKATRTIRVSTSLGSGDDEVERIKNEVRQITGGAMCDVVIDMVGHQSKTIELCPCLVKDDGLVLLFGLPPAKDDENPMAIRYRNFVRNIRYICSHSPGMESFELAVELLEQGRFDLSEVFTHRVPFERFPEAYEMASQYQDRVVKILLTF